MQDEEDTTIESEEADNEQIKQAQKWLNDHERPSFEVLMKLAKKHTPQAAEILQGYAEEYDVNWDPDRTLEDTVHQIWQAMESNSDATYK
jgi:hypothetical protein